MPQVLDSDDHRTADQSATFSTILFPTSVPFKTAVAVIRRFWEISGPRISESPVALAELRIVSVICAEDSQRPLEATFLPTLPLSWLRLEAPYIPFLPITDPDNDEWTFLEHIGVARSWDWKAALKSLRCLSQVGVQCTDFHLQEAIKIMQYSAQSEDATSIIR